MILSLAAAEIINRLLDASFEAFAVGGAVRDVIMGRRPNDFDIATNARTDEIKALFPDKLVIPTGEKHGTVTVLCSGEPIEVTTFRIDGNYNDSRHPETVTFVNDVTMDLARRDFTVNAIAYNDSRGFIDPFGGIEDIKRCVIRAVGDAETRFREDALRIMRCIRFASVLGFSIDKDTDLALSKCYQLLGEVSVERIYSELKLFLAGDFQALIEEYSYIFEFLFHGWKAPNTHLTHGESDVLTRMAYFFSGADVSAASSYLSFLKSDNATKKGVISILNALRYPLISSQADALRFLSEYGYEASKRAVFLRGRDEEIGLIEELRDYCYSIDRLEIDGKDISLLGYRGSDIGKAKKLLLQAVIEGKVTNEKDKLLNFLARQTI